jgi:hypothetical protein
LAWYITKDTDQARFRDHFLLFGDAVRLPTHGGPIARRRRCDMAAPRLVERRNDGN